MREITLFECGEEEDKDSFSPLTEDSMGLSSMFSWLNLSPCVAESGSLLHGRFNTKTSFIPSTSFMLLSKSPDVLRPLQSSLGIWDNAVHAKNS